MGTSAASDPLNFFIVVIYDLYMIYDLLIVFSSPSIEKSRIDHSMDLLHGFN